MNKQVTELVFILDRSGSMGGLESDTIGGYNGLLNKQKAEDADILLTTVLFDDTYEVLHDRIDIKQVKPLTDKEYYVRGSTALMDAIGRTVASIESKAAAMPKSLRPTKTLVVITTDGLENASCEFSAERVRAMIERKKEAGWEFLFLGANIDAIKTAEQYGISAARAANFHNDSEGIARNYESVSQFVSMMRCSEEKLDESWKAEIDADFESRK